MELNVAVHLLLFVWVKYRVKCSGVSSTLSLCKILYVRVRLLLLTWVRFVMYLCVFYCSTFSLGLILSKI